MEIADPQFEIGSIVEPTPDAAIKLASRVGRVESRGWTEFRDQPGYWRYTIRWPAGGTSSEDDKHLQSSDAIGCDLKVVVSGVPVKVDTTTTATVDELIEQAILKAGAATHPSIGWELRTEPGWRLTHLVGDAEPVDGETTLFLDPEVGGGGEQGGYIYTDPTSGTGWQGTPPAEGTRRAIVLKAIKKGDVLSDTEALEIADTVEAALLDAVGHRGCAVCDGDAQRDLAECYRLTGADPSDGSDAMLAREALDEVRRFRAEYDELETANAAVGEALDRIDAPQGATYAERIDRLYRMLLDRIDQARYIPRPEAKVPPQTRELVIVLEDVSDPDGPPEYRFIELENQDGRSIGSFPIRSSDRPPFKELAIPYGRDDAWVSEVAYQAAGAATRALLGWGRSGTAKTRSRVSDAVAELLSDFGIARACRPCAEEEIEQGAKEVDGRRDDTIKGLSERCDQLLEQRESARVGEDHFKAQRDASLHLLRWLIGDLIPSHLVDLAEDDS